MKQNAQGGFTIIEVMLFFAISALLITIAIATMNSSIQNARFGDATRSLEAFVESQFTNVQTGSLASNASQQPVCSPSGAIASYPTNSPQAQAGKGSCLTLGRVLQFNHDNASISVYPVLGFANRSYTGEGPFQALQAANPQVWVSGGTVDSFSLNWQANMAVRRVVYAQQADGVGNNFGPFDRIFFLRSINSEGINAFVANGDVPVSNLVASNSGAVSNLRNPATLICVQSGDMPALRGFVKLNGSGTGTGFSIGSIESSIQGADEVVFRDVTGRAGYGGVSCAN